MSKKFIPGVISANDLREGHVVYMNDAGQWVLRLKDAAFLDDPVIAEMWLDLANAQPEKVVGAYLAPATLGPNGPEPAHFREAFRASGPSIELPHNTLAGS
ncbi:DUF2849 domain-containing protein [Thioclava sp. JE_KL1]|uniref:DUF2849 domain-containing protein n=1 Tax=Thioclava sp. JE_KL1 TaxID=2651187 RepID=UPI0010684E57|nr:DUF2849 domain-containing protein [Thioclava sp. JE_KL1]MPQ93523.1 DUF2849 domain-containing protein [Thioclava sp. JE_KL1]